MRKYYLDNIKWVTVVTVVLYHVLYMYNAEGIVGVIGKITAVDVQYWDLVQYIVYPWIMILLFMVSGISSRLYLERHTQREFLKSRTRKLLVPSTIGLFAFQFIQGYVNASISGVFESAAGIPMILKALICVASGIGVLWYIQLLWVFSLLLILIRRIEKNKLDDMCRKTGIPALGILVVLVFGTAQILNTPIIVVYRFGLYFCVFLIGYYILYHDEVIEVLKKWFPFLAIVSITLCAAFCFRYFGQNYADTPVNRSPLFVMYGYYGSLAIIGGMARYGDTRNRFTEWMRKRSYGLYIFHYLGISAVGLLIGRPGLMPPAATYLLTLIAGFAGGYLLNAVISRIPGYRWAVMGIRKEKKDVQ